MRVCVCVCVCLLPCALFNAKRFHMSPPMQQFTGASIVCQNEVVAAKIKIKLKCTVPWNYDCVKLSH